MLLPVTARYGESNYSSLKANTLDPTFKCLLRFSEIFLDPPDAISIWYKKQHSTRFQTIQYHKEKTGVGHEFILLLLQRDAGGDVDCYCRVEREGGPKHRPEVPFVDGTIAKDYIQAIPLSNPDSASLTKDSDVVAEITFPLCFELRDVLAICYGISNHCQAKRYTLQEYNCYFYSWTLILALARACMNWESSPSIPEHVNNIRDRMMESIREQGPAKLHYVAYTLSNNTPNSHENKEHPLDQAIRSRLSNPAFTRSLTTALQGVLWTSRLPVMLTVAIDKDLDELASDSLALTALQHLYGPISRSTPEKSRNVDFKHAIGRLAQQAVLVAFDDFFPAAFEICAAAFPAFVTLKQRLGHEAWFKELASGIRHPGRFFHLPDVEIPSSEPWLANPHRQRPISSSMRDLCFIPPSAILGFSAHSMLTVAMTIGMCYARVHVSLKGQEIHRKNVFQRVALRGRTIARSAAHEIGAFPHHISTSQHLIYAIAVIRATQKLDPTTYAHLRQMRSNGHLRLLVTKGLCQAFTVFDSRLQELIKHDGAYQPSVLRKCVTFGILSILDVLNYNSKKGWGLILQQCFSEKLTGTAERELEGLVHQAHLEHVFQVNIKHDNGLSKASISDLGTHESDIRSVKISAVTLPSQDCPATNPNADTWSYQDLQSYIRQRISQLTNQETEFGPYLKCVSFIREATACQNDIELAMEEIWIASQPLLGARPHTVQHPAVCMHRVIQSR